MQLKPNEVHVSEWIDKLSDGDTYNAVGSMVQPSAPGTLVIEQSENKQDITYSVSQEIPANETTEVVPNYIKARYFRLKYINGAEKADVELRVVRSYDDQQLDLFNTVIFEGAATFEAGQSEVELEVPIPRVISKESFYGVAITNAGELGLTVEVRNRETFRGVEKFPLFETINVEASTPEGTVTIVQGFLLGDGGKFVIKADSAAVNAFDVEVKVRKLY